MNKKRTILTLSIIAVLLTGAVAAWIFIANRDDGASTTVDPEAQEVAQALSKLPDDPEVFLPSNSPESLRSQVRELIPPGSTVKVDESSWMKNEVGLSGGSVVVEIRRPGESPTEYLTTVAKEDGVWKVLGTLEID